MKTNAFLTSLILAKFSLTKLHHALLDNEYYTSSFRFFSTGLHCLKYMVPKFIIYWLLYK